MFSTTHIFLHISHLISSFLSILKMEEKLVHPPVGLPLLSLKSPGWGAGWLLCAGIIEHEKGGQRLRGSWQLL
jgi:hypothetical protein